VFRIAVEFLSGRCYAARWEAPDRPDWPVDSARFFSGMTAAIRRIDPGEQVVARRWLESVESLAPPVVVAVEPPLNPPRAFSYAVRPVVAVNQKLKLPVINPRTDRLPVTSTPLLDPVLIFEYDADIAEAQRPVIERLLANVTYVGSSESMVRAYLTDEADHEKHVRYVPRGHAEFRESKHGLITLRAPSNGRLAHLDAAYADLQRAGRNSYEPRTLGQARPVTYAITRSEQQQSATISYADMDEMVPLEFVGRFENELADKSYGNLRNRPDLDSGRFAVATSAVRRAFLSNLGDNAPEELTGHPIGQPNERTTLSHVAFVPLAEIGFLHATSRLRGVAMVLPRSLTNDLRQQALKAFRFPFITFGNVSWTVKNLLDSDLTSLKPQRYRASSRTWVTATPIVLPRYPKRREGVVDIVARALANAGLPTPDSIETSPVPFVEGAYPVASYRQIVPGNRYIVHARIVFEGRVRGPVMIGRHRHQGYGLCLPQLTKATEIRTLAAAL
jgi:CRISPR-associated protein Csb2